MAFATYLELCRRHPRTLTFGFLFAFFSSPGQTFLVSLFVPSINAEFGLQAGEFGTLVSAATLAGALLLPLLGRLIDTLPIGLYAALVAAFLGCACVLAGLAPALPVLMVAVFGLRLGGQGLMTHTAATIGGRYFGRARGTALGLIAMGHSIGEALFPITVVTLIGLLGWRGGYIALGAALMALCIPAALLLPRGADRPSTAGATAGAAALPAVRSSGRREMLRSPFFYAVLPATLCYGFVSTGLIFHQSMVAAEKGWSLEWMAVSFTVYAGASLVGLIGIGPATDRLTARRLYPFYMAPMCLGLAALAAGDDPTLAPLFFGLTGLSSGFARTLRTAVWAEAYGTQHLGAVRSLVVSMQSVFTALAPAVFGWGLAYGGVTPVVLASLALTGVCSVLAWLAPSPREA
ncbi:MAG: MFS transporter [Acetobacterales bacterium]